MHWCVCEEMEACPNENVWVLANVFLHYSLYQETVGLAIVHHEDMPVLDLRELHKYLDSRLHSTKWPQLLVFMDGLPKSATNKVLRVGFAKRASLQQLHRSTPMKDCLFRAEAPPQVRGSRNEGVFVAGNLLHGNQPPTKSTGMAHFCHEQRQV